MFFEVIIGLHISIHHEFLKFRSRKIEIHGMVPFGPRQDKGTIYNLQRNQTNHGDEHRGQGHDAHNGKNLLCNGII